MAAENHPFPDPIYIAIDGAIVSGPIKKSCLLDVTITLITAYYAFNVEYPPHCNVFPFFGYALFDNKTALRKRLTKC